MTSVQEESQQGSKQGKNNFSGLVIFPKDIEAQLNTTSALLDIGERELDDPLHHVGDWTQNQAKSIEKNIAWTKKEIIHILVLAQQTEKLEPFFEKLRTEEGHQTKKLLEDIIDLGCTYLEDPFAKKNNDKNHERTNNANGKAPEESNVEDHNNIAHIQVQSEAHMPEKGTHFNTMGATSRKSYRSQMKAPGNMPRDGEIQ
ncbi:hypothetical protein V6N11_064852 [Hibiscus sabdariffa]|uniref:Uncharacterized protein n=1 Tax=Hibiscus sabdariffa TaxID=183260 RepID=A0ABR2SJ65_9ROSI